RTSSCKPWSATTCESRIAGAMPVWKLLIVRVDMRTVKLSGREASVVRAIGFANSMLGAEIQDYVRMESDDVTDILNSLMAAGFVESIPYSEQIDLAGMAVTAFEVN